MGQHHYIRLQITNIRFLSDDFPLVNALSTNQQVLTRPMKGLSNDSDGLCLNLNRLDSYMTFHILVGPERPQFLDMGRPSFGGFLVCGVKYDGIWLNPEETGMKE